MNHASPSSHPTSTEPPSSWDAPPAAAARPTGVHWNRGALALRLLAELGPAVLFFVVLRATDIYWATLVLVATGLASTAWSWRRERRLPVLPSAMLALTLVLGGLTYALQDPQFVKLRPTITNLAGAAALAVAFAFGRLPLRHALDGATTLPDDLWARLTWALITFLLVLAALNEVVWRTTSTDTWAAFKAFGIPLLNGLFIFGAWRWVLRHPQAADVPAEDGGGAR